MMIMQMSKWNQVLTRIRTAYTHKQKKYPLIGEKTRILLKNNNKREFFEGEKMKIQSFSSGADYQQTPAQQCQQLKVVNTWLCSE